MNSTASAGVKGPSKGLKVLYLMPGVLFQNLMNFKR